MRPHPGAPVSTPVTWEEIEADPPRHNLRTIGDRVAQVGDLFRPVLSLTQDLRRATESLKAML